MVPYPKAHYLLASYSPSFSEERKYLHPYATELTYSCFEPANTMVRCDPKMGRLMGLFMLYRGDYVPKDIGKAYSSIKANRTIQFVDWCTGGCRMGLNYRRPSFL